MCVSAVLVLQGDFDGVTLLQLGIFVRGNPLLSLLAFSDDGNRRLIDRSLHELHEPQLGHARYRDLQPPSFASGRSAPSSLCSIDRSSIDAVPSDPLGRAPLKLIDFQQVYARTAAAQWSIVVTPHTTHFLPIPLSDPNATHLPGEGRRAGVAAFF